MALNLSSKEHLCVVVVFSVAVLPHLSLMVGAGLTSSCPEGRSTFKTYLCVGRHSCALHQGHVCCVIPPNTRAHQMVPRTTKKEKIFANLQIDCCLETCLDCCSILILCEDTLYLWISLAQRDGF